MFVLVNHIMSNIYSTNAICNFSSNGRRKKLIDMCGMSFMLTLSKRVIKVG